MFYQQYWELVTGAPQPFDPAKLRKGDKVLVVAKVHDPDLDYEGDVMLCVSGRNRYVKPANIIGYAPGYTPQRDEPLKVGDRVASSHAPGDAGEIKHIAHGMAAVEYADELTLVALRNLTRVEG